jgi:hypothetical protein
MIGRMVTEIAMGAARHRCLDAVSSRTRMDTMTPPAPDTQSTILIHVSVINAIFPMIAAGRNPRLATRDGAHVAPTTLPNIAMVEIEDQPRRLGSIGPIAPILPEIKLVATARTGARIELEGDLAWARTVRCFNCSLQRG